MSNEDEKENILDYLTDEDGSEEAFKKQMRDRVVASVSANISNMDTDSFMMASDKGEEDTGADEGESTTDGGEGDGEQETE